MKTIGQGFALTLPAGWADRTMTTLVGPTGRSGFATNIIITQEPVAQGLTSADYARSQLQIARAQMPFLEIVDERSLPLNGAMAFQRLQRFYAEGHHVQQAQTYIVSGLRAFVITYSAAMAEFDSGLPALRQVTETFHLFDPEGVVP